MSNFPNPSRRHRNVVEANAIVAFRFVFMLGLLVAFAVFVRGIPFLRALEELTFLAALVSAIVAAIRGDVPLAAELNRWDEALAMSTCALGAGVLAAI